LKAKLLALIALTAVTGLLFSTTQSGDAQTYYGHDGSVDKYITKVKVDKLKGKGDLWAYIVKACPDDRNIRIAEVILRSDVSERHLGVNKYLAKGKCSYYGAVMSAKDSKTLGAEIIEMHEALEKIQSLEKGFSGMSKSQRSQAINEYIYYKTLTGF